MKYIFIRFTACVIGLLLTVPIFAETINPLRDSVHIRGRFLHRIDNGMVVQVMVIQNYASPLWTSFSKTYEAAVDTTGRFDISFCAGDRLFYCRFLFEDSHKRPVAFSDIQGVAPIFLMESGDDLTMEIYENDILFGGAGAAKMNCQYLLNLNPIYPRHVVKALRSLVDSKRYEKGLDYWQEVVEDNLKINLGIIEAYNGHLSDSVKRVLRYDYIGLAYRAIYKKFQEESGFGYDFELYKRKLHALQLKTAEIYDDLAAFSWGYINYLYEKEKTIAMYDNGNGAIKKNYRYAKLFNKILERDSGLIRDNLLVTSYINSMNKQIDIYDFESKLSHRITDTDIRTLFANWIKRSGTRSAAFPFVLPDTLEKLHRLEDFKGKILVIDFWFNGCTGCVALNKAIDPVIRKYKNNPKVQFLSISVGQSRTGWINGIRSGIYTHPEQIMLSTHGKRPLEAEIVKFYNYNSFPRLLLIDEQGRTIKSNAPDPRLDGGVALIRTIEELI